MKAIDPLLRISLVTFYFGKMKLFVLNNDRKRTYFKIIERSKFICNNLLNKLNTVFKILN